MAAEGMRFTNWYAEASCTPGRAAIQTGRMPMRSALTVALGPGDKNKIRSNTRVSMHVPACGVFRDEVTYR
jgi:arylsulfatase